MGEDYKKAEAANKGAQASARIFLFGFSQYFLWNGKVMAPKAISS